MINLTMMAHGKQPVSLSDGERVPFPCLFTKITNTSHRNIEMTLESLESPESLESLESLEQTHLRTSSTSQLWSLNIFWMIFQDFPRRFEIVQGTVEQQ